MSRDEQLEKIRRPFFESFNVLQQLVYSNAKEKGFWDEDYGAHTDATKAMLVVTEISEYVEARREGDNQPSTKIPGYTLAEEEIADAIIRLMDLAGGRNLHIAGAILKKVEYNKTRPAMHGKKF